MYVRSFSGQTWPGVPYNGHEATLEVSHRIHWGRTPGQVWPGLILGGYRPECPRVTPSYTRSVGISARCEPQQLFIFVTFIFSAGGRLRPAGHEAKRLRAEECGAAHEGAERPKTIRRLAGRGGRGRRGDRPRRRSQEIDAGLLGTCGFGSHIVARSLHRPRPPRRAGDSVLGAPRKAAFECQMNLTGGPDYTPRKDPRAETNNGI